MSMESIFEDGNGTKVFVVDGGWCELHYRLADGVYATLMLPEELPPEGLMAAAKYMQDHPDMGLGSDVDGDRANAAASSRLRMLIDTNNGLGWDSK